MFDTLLHLIQSYGYLGLFALMFLENIFPPIPSELIVPLAGFLCAQGSMDPGLVILSTTAGAVAGALPWYGIGRGFGRRRTIAMVKRFGLWMTVSVGELRKAKRLFDRYGSFAVLGGRLIPAIRTLISVPAGIAEMNFLRFLVLTAIGSAAWNVVLTAAGYVLEDRYAEVQHIIDPITKGIVLLVVAIYVVRLGLQLWRRRAAG